MNASATPDHPVQDAAEDQASSAEPAWIEVGSPKRRTAPPAWSDEVAHDAWDDSESTDETARSQIGDRVEVGEAAAPASAASADETPHTAGSVDGAPDARVSADEAPDARGSADEAPGAWASADEALEAGASADAWVQEPTAEPTPATQEVLDTEPAEAHEEQGSEGHADPESGDRWQVVHDTAPPVGAESPSQTTAELSSEELAAEEAAQAQAQEQQEQTGPSAPSTPTAGGTATRPAPSRPGAPHRPRAYPVPGTGPLHLRGNTTPAPRTAGSPQRPAQQPAAAPSAQTAAHPSDVQAAPAHEAAPAPGKTAQGRARGTLSGALDLVLPHLQAHRAALIVGLVSLVLSIWMLVALPFPLKFSIDAALVAAGAEPTAPTGIGSDPDTALMIAAGALAALVALQAGFRALSVSVLNRMGGRVATDLRGQLLDHLHRLSPGRDIDDLGRTTSPLVEDVARLRDLVAHTGPRLLTGLLALVSLLLMMLVVEPIAALIVLATATLFALAARVSLTWQRRRETAAAADETLLAETADELLAATRTIQSYGLEGRASHSLAELGERTGRSRSAARRSRAVGGFVTELITGLGVGAALLLGGWRMNAGTMTPGELTMVVAAVLIAVVLAREVVQHSTGLRAIVAAGDRVGELLDHRAAITEPGRAQQIGALRGEIVYSALSTEGRRGPLFDGVSLVIPAGEHVALVGRDGAEASALISYLLRFDEPDSGRVLLDRYDTRALSLADLRSGLAVVQRESALFSESVRENIRAGRPDASDDEIVDAARRSGADDFITLLPDGYDTHLARRGAALTDGQRRRLAITRALLRDAPVVVLEDADADLVPAERDAVQRALGALTAGRTALISSREPETILDADRALCFEAGALAEDGAPAELADDPDSWLAVWLRSTSETAG